MFTLLRYNPVMLSLRTVLTLSLSCFVFAASAADSLFADHVIAKCNGIEIRDSDLQEAYVGFKAARAALGQGMPPVAESAMRQQVLEKLIATKLLLAKATPADHEEGKKTAEK